MMGFLIVFHAIVCVLLIIIILIQAGRGGGLVEGFSGVESMFGPKTSTFLTRTTSVLSTIFLVSCVTLAVLSARQSRSLLRDTGKSGAAMPVQQEIPVKPSGPANTTSRDNKQVMPKTQALPKQESAPSPAAAEEPPKK